MQTTQNQAKQQVRKSISPFYGGSRRDFTKIEI